jgi:alkylated DNA nucleotide flippase Atl1
VRAPLSPTPKQWRKPNGRQSRRQDSTRSARARAVVLALTRYRILSFGQLRRLVFPDRTPQRVGQILRQLAADGWLRVWEDVSRVGGRPRYALPTRQALASILPRLEDDATNSVTERLATLMLPQHPRRPLTLAPRAVPSFLAHQREVNDLLIAYEAMPDTRVRWATSWDRPFPLRAGDLALPQPDYVLVLERNGVPALVFGEHDRGHESLAHFRRAKAERYAALAAQPELVRALFGFPSFMVWVTVLDARSGAPHRRLARLVRVAYDAGASEVMAFTLAGWAATTPADAIWFCDARVPDTTNVRGARAIPELRALPLAPRSYGAPHR